MGYTLDPAVVPPHTTAKDWARFCAKTVVTSRHVIWVAGLSGGYGTFYDEGFRFLDLELADHKSTVTATRWLWTAWNGPIERGQRVKHRCDLPICVRLEDLELGSQRENVLEARDRDRLVRRRGRVRVDNADTRGLAGQSLAIRHAVLTALDAGIADPGQLDELVAAVVTEGSPASIFGQDSLFGLTDLPAPAARTRRLHSVGAA